MARVTFHTIFKLGTLGTEFLRGKKSQFMCSVMLRSNMRVSTVLEKTGLVEEFFKK